MSDSVTSLSNFLLTTGLIGASNSQLAKLTQQMSSGQQQSSLVGYGSSAQTVLNLQSGKQQIQGYQQSNTIVSTYLGAYSDSIQQLQKDANTLQGALTAFDANDAVSVANLKTAVTGVMTDISATLNSQVDSRYIFGGTGARMTTAPVTDDMIAQFQAQVAAGLPSPAPGITDPAQGFIVAQPSTSSDTAGTLPNYDTAYVAPAPTNPPTMQEPTTAPDAATTNGSYGTQTVTAGDNRQVTYGISSNDPSIQALIYSVQNAYFAISTATASQANPAPGNQAQLASDAQTFIGNAKSAVNTAIYGGTSTAGTDSSGNGVPSVTVVGLQNLAQQVGAVQGTMSDINTLNTQTMANLTLQTSSLEAVDSTSVAEQISALENQLNASYKVTSSLMSMSLLNYL